MLKREAAYTASEVLTDEQLELVAGGYSDGGDIPICPPLPPRPWSGPGPVPYNAALVTIGGRIQ